ncbi:MAG: proline dehydrogenase family protein [Anaerolineales bacterium]
MVVRELNQKGICASLNHLGEYSVSPTEAAKATDDNLELLERIHANGLRASISIELTQIGLTLDESLAEQNLARLLGRATELKSFIRIDMENSPYTEATVRLCRLMRQKGFSNVGVVIQAYLYRSEHDLRELITEGTRVRLVKGAYRETRDLVFPKKADTNSNYDRLARLMIDDARSAGSPSISQDGPLPPLVAIGSHDPLRLENAKNYALQVGLPRQAIEFQMIYGIRRDLQERYLAEGYPVRVYVPYGTQWYPYFMRRLAERPANLWFFLSNSLRA